MVSGASKWSWMWWYVSDWDMEVFQQESVGNCYRYWCFEIEMDHIAVILGLLCMGLGRSQGNSLPQYMNICRDCKLWFVSIIISVNVCSALSLLACAFRTFFWGDPMSVSLSASSLFCFLFPMTLGSAPSNAFFAAAHSLACLAFACLATVSGLLTIHILAANETMNHVPVPSIARNVSNLRGS